MTEELYIENIPGNLHEAAERINRRGLAEYVLHMDSVGRYTIVVFRMPVGVAIEIRTGGQTAP